MLKCHSVEKELIQPTLPEDLKLWTIGAKADEAQVVRPFNWWAVAGSASPAGSRFYREKTLATRCPTFYLLCAGIRNFTCNLCGLQVNTRIYSRLLSCLLVEGYWLGGVHEKSGVFW
jgi:hypothetical protein